MAIDYKSPIIILWNTDSSGNPVSEEILNESKQVVQNTIVLTQIPDKFYRVLITGFVEIEQHEEIISETQFKVNYQNGIITFHPSQEGQTINIDRYYGRGVIFTPASRIYTSVDDSGNITQTLYDIIELGEEAIDNLEELDTIVSNAQAIIDDVKYVGEYNELLSYKKNNTVSLNGYSYLAFQDVPIGVSPPIPPTISNDYWGMVSAKGDKGDIGIGLNYNWDNTQLGVKREDEAEYQYTDLKGDKGDKGDKGVNWKGEYSSIVNYIVDDVVENAGSSWICISPTVGNPPPTLPTTSNTWWELFAQKGLDGEGSGDMLKSVYDSNSDGKVDEADVADTLTNMQSSVQDIDSAVSVSHTHTNKTVIDKFTEVEGELLYDNNPIGEVTQAELDDLAGVGRTTETVKGNADAIAALQVEVSSPDFTPDIYNTASIFTAGVGKDENDIPLDYSDSIVEGQVSVSVKGITLKNELNYNRDTWAEWEKLDATSVFNNCLKLQRTTQGVQARLNYAKFKPSTKYGFLLYVNEQTGAGSMQTQGSNRAFGDGVTIIPSGDGIGNKKAILTTKPDFTSDGLSIKLSSNDSTTTIKDIRIFELPAGSEIEADFNNLTADQLAIKYPYISGDSTKSTVSTRLKSVGKNLFDEPKVSGDFDELLGGVEINNDGTALIISGGTSYSRAYTKPIKLKPNTQYTLSADGYGDENINKRIQIRDATTDELLLNTVVLPTTRGIVSGSFTTGETAEIRLLYYPTSTVAGTMYVYSVQLEEGGTATAYEEYKESVSYIDVPLRSLPNGVKDEVNDKGVLTRRIKDSASLNDFSIIRNTSGDTENYYSMQVAIPNINYVEINNYTGNKIEGQEYSVFDGFAYWIYYSASWIRIKIPKTEIDGTIDDIKAKAWFEQKQVSLTYQLAEPVITDIDITPLYVYENGTIIIDPYYRKSLKYDATTGNGLDFEYALSEIEKVTDIDGNEVDLSFVTLATDGLSATISGAVDGETYTVYGYIKTEESTIPTTVMSFPCNLSAQVAGNNKGIQQLSNTILSLQDQVAMLIVLQS